MNKIARKYFLAILLGSVIFFAIDEVKVNAAPINNHSIQNLEGDFWDKFRESVMKDRDKEKSDEEENTEPSNDEVVGSSDK